MNVCFDLIMLFFSANNVCVSFFFFRSITIAVVFHFIDSTPSTFACFQRSFHC